ncbi:MAG: glycosyltransferase [Myxococcales bacterium]|nr:glycosyltransferase [Myxococcales bacterium]
MLPALARRRPVLFETYRPLIRQYPLARWPLRLAARRPGFLGIVTHSDYSRRSFEEEGLPPEKLRTIYNGYDDHAFARLVTPAEARAELGLPEKPTIVYAGRIAPFKQIDLLLDAYEHMPHGTQLILAGAIDTAEAQPLVERARELGAILPGYLTGEAFARALMAGEIVTIPPSARPLAEFGNTVLPIKTFQYLAAGRVLVVGDTPTPPSCSSTTSTACASAPTTAPPTSTRSPPPSPTKPCAPASAPPPAPAPPISPGTPARSACSRSWRSA